MPPKPSSITVPAALTGEKSVRLVYSHDRIPGISRRKSKAGFMYLDASGRPVKDAATLERIRALAIPPAYTNVWICEHSDGHLQATGRDARGRKQYRYHRLWRTLREREKFTHLRAFGKRLPALRRRLRLDLKSPGLHQQKVLALTVSILEGR